MTAFFAAVYIRYLLLLNYYGTCVLWQGTDDVRIE